MEDYKKYIEERMERIYEAYDSVILEAHKEEKDKHHVKMCKDGFLNYLEYKYNNEDIRYEIKSAKTDKEREKIAKKYAKDFEEWKKANKKVNLSAVGMIFSAAMGGATGAPIWLLVYFILFGVLLKTSKDIDNKRDEEGIKKYNAKHGKK